MLRLVGIDLAGRSEKPSGWALLKGRTVSVKELHTNQEILFETVNAKPALVAIDAPLTLPEQGSMRKADRDMRQRGYPVLPPLFPAMKELTLRAIRLVEELRRGQIKAIEVHPTSTRKALQMPLKDWHKIQEIFIEMGLINEWKKRALTPHETDAITAAITALLYIRGETESIGDKKSCIIVPLPAYWRKYMSYFAQSISAQE